MAVPTKKTRSAKKTVRTVQAKTKKVAAGINLPSFAADGSKGEAIPVTQALGEKVAPHLVSQAVRVYQTARRQGTASTKTRGEVTGSTRKIYRQKGTGRARHGAITAPVFVGGGIVHGPRPRPFDVALPQKMRERAFWGIVVDKMQREQVRVVLGLGETSGKTKDVAHLLSKMELTGKKVLFIIDPSMKKAVLGARNLAKVTIRSAISVSLLDIIEHTQVIVAKEALETLLKRAPDTIKKATV